MKKFFLLLKKEIGEMLSPQLWIPFIAVIVVFFVIGNVANQQMKDQAKTKDSIAISDLDQSKSSVQAIQAVAQSASVVEISSNDSNEFIEKMKENKTQVGIIIPKNFERNILTKGNTSLETYALMNNFSVLAGKKLAILDISTATINEVVSNNLINSKIDSDEAILLKHPVTPESYVSANGKISEGNATQLLNYVMGQTTLIPIVLFIIIVMAAQMIASAVATEKENKTLETLLSLPISRRSIVTSKMLAAGLVSLVMAGVYIISFKNFNGGISGVMSGIVPSQDSSAIAQTLGLKFTTLGFIELGIILFLAILLALAIAMILGAFAEDAKSAQGVIAPLMILVMIPYFVTLFMDISSLSPAIKYIIYAIPFSHLFLAMSNILLGHQALAIAGGVYMLVLFIVFVLIAAKIFSSDLILTMKLNFSKKKSDK